MQRLGLSWLRVAVLITMTVVLLPSVGLSLPIFGFGAITNNSGISTTIASQFTVELFDLGSNQISFTFTNASGRVASFINQIYWEDNANILDSFASVASGFTSPATPGNLPASEFLGFDADFSVDADPPPSSNGLSPGESGTFIFNTAAQPMNETAWANLLAAIDAGTFRMGIHVQGINGTSDSFVSGYEGAPVPEPSTLVLLSTTLIAFGIVRKKLF